MSTLTTIRLNPQTVADLFKVAKSQGEILVGLYKMAVPGWEDIVEVNAYPTCSSATWEEICKLFWAFDTAANQHRSLDKQVLPGGCWMNSGFSTPSSRSDIELALWEVLPIPEDKLKRKATA